MTDKHRRAIADIVVGTRHRKELGDIAQLANSIKEQGLLQPIGILPDNQLVFGYRRLLACGDLGWTEIDVRVVNVTNLVEGEMHENEMRKQFAPSERAAIFKSIETVKAGRPEIRRGRDELKRPNKDAAAKMAGFASRGSAYRAVKVVDSGIPEVIEAMDKSEITINAAEKIAKQPPEKQQEALVVAKAQNQPVKREKKPKKAKPPQKTLAQVFDERDKKAGLNNGMFTSPDERGFPPPELANQQHPDYPPGVTYANAHRIQHGRVVVFPIKEQEQMKVKRKFDAAFGSCRQLKRDDLDKLNDKRRGEVLWLIRKVFDEFRPVLDTMDNSVNTDTSNG